METKRFVLLLAFGLLLLYGWNIAFNAIGKRMGYDMSARKPAVAASTEPASAAASTGPASDENDVFKPSPAEASGTGAVDAIVAPGEEVATIGSDARDDPTFALALDTTVVGAGVERVELNKYQQTIYKQDPYAFERPGTVYPDETRALAVRSVIVDGTEIDLTKSKWARVAHDAAARDGKQSVTYAIDVLKGGAPAVRLSRTYTVFAQPKDPADGLDSHGLEIRVYDAFKNLTDKPITVALRYNAPPVPPTEAERIADSYIVLATADGDYASARGYPAGSIPVDNPHDLVKDYADHGRPWYLGSMTGYFAALQRFEPELNGKAPADRVQSFVLRRLTPNDSTATTVEDELLVSLKPVTVGAGAETGFGSRVYFGPKKREWLTNAYYKQPWIQFDQVLALKSSWWICGLCTWQWLVNILFSVLTTLHWVVRDWGLSIVLLTCIVRLCLHPITKRAQMSMLSFGKHAPEMAKIKERYKDDQEAMQKAMWAFQREHGMKQVMGCLPMFLQAPIWIALWSAMSSTFELRHQPFLYGLTWIHDLSRPDHLIDFGQTFHMPILSMITISGLNVLPLLFGVLQFVQFKTQPQPPTMTEEQRQQQQMTQWMMLTLFPLFMYGSPSGLLIYMITSFTIGIIESKLIKREFNRREAEAAKFQVVDAAVVAPGKSASVQKATVRRKANEPRKPGLMGMLEEWKRRAEEMQREVEKNRKKPR